jgi:hypothetical protein
MYACACEIGGGFFVGVCVPGHHSQFSRDRPTLQLANGSMPALCLRILAAANLYLLP